MSKTEIKRLYLIPILSKALDVLELLGKSNSALASEDIYQQTKISRTGRYRILKTLAHRNYVTQNESGQYRLDSCPRRLRFGFAAQGGEMPFSAALTASITAAAEAAGVELLQLDNRYDPDVAKRNAEEFVRQRVDLVFEFQIEEHVGPLVAHVFKNAAIPHVAIGVPYPDATYFGVDNFEVGREAGILLGQHATSVWKGRVLGVLVALNISQRNCTSYCSWMGMFLMNETSRSLSGGRCIKNFGEFPGVPNWFCANAARLKYSLSQ